MSFWILSVQCNFWVLCSRHMFQKCQQRMTIWTVPVLFSVSYIDCIIYNEIYFKYIQNEWFLIKYLYRWFSIKFNASDYIVLSFLSCERVHHKVFFRFFFLQYYKISMVIWSLLLNWIATSCIELRLITISYS